MMTRQHGFVLIESVLMAAIVFILAALIWKAYSDSRSPTMELKKNEWVCTKQEVKTCLQPVPINNTVQMLPIASSVCVEYKRHGG